MSKKLVWDQVGEHFYSTGTDRGVLFVTDTKGVYGIGAPWSGLTGVSLSPSGAEASALYANNKKYLNLISDEEMSYTITAYQSPVEFDACDGSTNYVDGVAVGQQPRRTFGFSFRTLIGNDTENAEYGYLIHLIYGSTASPSSKEYKSVNADPEAIELSWECSTIPIEFTGMKKPTSHIVIDSTKVDADKLKQLEDMLCGTDTTDSKLPMPADLIALFGAASDKTE